MTDTASIGEATLESDGTIVLLLRATQDGMVRDARITHPPGDVNDQ